MCAVMTLFDVLFAVCADLFDGLQQRSLLFHALLSPTGFVILCLPWHLCYSYILFCFQFLFSECLHCFAFYSFSSCRTFQQCKFIMSYHNSRLLMFPSFCYCCNQPQDVFMCMLHGTLVVVCGSRSSQLLFTFLEHTQFVYLFTVYTPCNLVI